MRDPLVGGSFGLGLRVPKNLPGPQTAADGVMLHSFRCRRGSPYQRVWGGVDGQGFRRPAAKRSGAARRRQRIGLGPDGRPRQRRIRCPLSGPRQGAGLLRRAVEWRRARSPVQSPLAAAEAAPLASGLPRGSWTIVDHRRRSGAAHLVLKSAPGAAKARDNQKRGGGLKFLWPTLPLRGPPRLSSGRRRTSGDPSYCPATARTACIAVGAEDFPSRPLGVYRTCLTSLPAHWTYPTCLGRVRAGRTAHKSIEAKGAP